MALLDDHDDKKIDLVDEYHNPRFLVVGIMLMPPYFTEPIDMDVVDGTIGEAPCSRYLRFLWNNIDGERVVGSWRSPTSWNSGS